MIYRIIKPAAHAIEGVVWPGGSKSISNRLLIIRKLCEKPFRIDRLSESKDTRILADLLEKMPPHMDVGEGAAPFRFLTALLAITPGEWMLTGSASLLKRPVHPLVDALNSLGADIEYAGEPGFPPLHIRGKSLDGGFIRIRGDISSQFISALMLIGPAMTQGLVIEVTGEPVSRPYITMTIALMQQFGVQVYAGRNRFEIPAQKYLPVDVTVEPDWSGAVYFYEIAALSNRAEILISGLRHDTLQGDAQIARIAHHFGVQSIEVEEGILLRKFHPQYPANMEYDLREFPDMALSLITLAEALEIPYKFSGLEHLRYKESNRLHTLNAELTKARSLVEKYAYPLVAIAETEDVAGEIIETHEDHRIAMAIAPLALLTGSLLIRNPGVVSKSFPAYWDQLQHLGFQIEEF